jgi:hypothetical protein
MLDVHTAHTLAPAINSFCLEPPVQTKHHQARAISPLLQLLCQPLLSTSPRPADRRSIVTDTPARLASRPKAGRRGAGRCVCRDFKDKEAPAMQAAAAVHGSPRYCSPVKGELPTASDIYNLTRIMCICVCEGGNNQI